MPAAKPTSPAESQPVGSVLYADASYTDYEWEDTYREVEQVDMQADRRANSKRPHEPWQNFLIQHFRKGVKTTISQFTERFPKSIHAVTTLGFALKLLLLVFTFTIGVSGLG
jgi:hypothetical protein